MKKIINLALAAAVAFTFTAPLAMEASAKKRSEMTASEKKALRERAREYCRKAYAKGLTQLERVEIQSNGKVICWLRG